MSGKLQPPVEKHTKNPRRKGQQDHIDYFETIYGNFDFVNEGSIPKYSPRFAGYGNPALRSMNELPIAPAPINLEKTRRVIEESKERANKSALDLHTTRENRSIAKKQTMVPLLTIPKKQTSKIPATSRPAVLAPLVPTIHPAPIIEPEAIKTPRAANDNLALFDETDFDTAEYHEEIKRRVAQGPTPAFSIYASGKDKYEWRECNVIEVNGPFFKIRWCDTGRTKTVQRLGVMLKTEDPVRFEQRRNLALKNRTDTVSMMKLQTYLHMRSTENFVQHEPTILEETIKLLPGYMRKSRLIPKLVQEVNSLFSFSHTLHEYREEWKDPQRAKQFAAEGLIETKSCQSEEAVVIKPLKTSLINSIVLPEPKMVILTAISLLDFISEPFVTDCIKSLPLKVPFVYFLTGVLDNLRSKYTYAYEVLIPNIQINLMNIISYTPDKEDVFTIMMNMRVNHAIANMILNTLNNFVPTLKENKMLFRLNVMSDLETFIPSRNTFENTGITYINMIYNFFENNKLQRVSSEVVESQELKIFLPELENSKNKAVNDWMGMSNDSFGQIQAYIDDINHTVEAIPRDPFAECVKILPEDFAPFIKEGKMPTIDSREIDLDLVRKKLSASLNAYKEFVLKFEEKRKFGLFDVDFTKFFTFIKEKKDEFYQLIFKYMNAQTDKQVNIIGGMTNSLIQKTTCAPLSVEEWYDKHIILVHIMSHIGEIQATLDYLLVMMSFMGEFLFEPEQSFKTTYAIKNNLHNIVLGIDTLNKKDNEEKIMFIEKHRKEIEIMKSDLKNFCERLLEYNARDVNENTKEVNQKLLQDKKNFDKIVETCLLYKERDKKLEIEVTEYPIIEEITEDFNLYIPAWDISYKIMTEANSWLGTIFRQLDVKYITETVVGWEKVIKGLISYVGNLKTTERHKKYVIDGEHQIEKPLAALLKRVQYFILHIPIIRYFCNPLFRIRHWRRISEVTKIQIGPNDGVTWIWLIEMGIENNIVEIASISKSADIEAKIEKAITQMCEELTSISFKVQKVGKKIKLIDPSIALIMLNRHQQIMQEIFVPPYVQVFISKIKEYEELAKNIRNILKQSIETEEKINELRPAMDSTDLRSQHGEMTTKFDNKVEDFKDFAESFKISATFHRILSNQTTADLCDSISKDFVTIQKQLMGVLELKRKAFPRFRLLSDSQLIHIISNSDNPESFADMFSMMYPEIKEATFDDNKLCTGFKSYGGEVFEFVNRIKVNPKSVEGWMIEFDDQIRFTLKTLGRKIMQSPISSIEKMVFTYPSQLLSLVFEINFTTNVNKCFASFEGNFTEYAKPKLIEQLNIVLDAVTNDLQVLKDAYRKSNSVQISNMVIVLMNHKAILEEILKNDVSSRQNPIWLSTPKYTLRNMEKFIVDVTVGSCTIPYGFEYAGNNFPVFLTKEIRKFFSQMMSCICGGALPLACGWDADRKSNYLIQFLNKIGKQPFVYPCHYHTTLERMKEFIDKAAQCNSYVIFKDVYRLKFNVLSDFATELVAMKSNLPTHIFATYTYNDSSFHVPEILKLAFNPIDLTNLGYRRRFDACLNAMGADSSELADKLTNLVKTVTKAFKSPLNSAFSFLSLIQIIQSAPILSDNPCHEIHNRIIDYTVKKFGEEQSSQLIKYVDALFEEKSNVKLDIVDLKMHPDPSINDRLISLHELIKVHYGVIISGPTLAGKSALIKMYCKQSGLKPKFINPLSIDLSDLYGDKDSGVLSTILQEHDTIVFDGPCDPSWIETLVLGLSSKRRMYFGDGSMLNLRSNVRFIIETTDISNASPAILALCGTIYLGQSFLTIKQRVEHFIEKISNDQNLIEPISQTIISSQVPAEELVSTLNKAITFFMNYVDSVTPLTSFFKIIIALIYNYYLPSMDQTHIHHTAEELIESIPSLVAFGIYWSWAGRVIDDDRTKLDDKFTKATQEYGIDLKGHKISEVYFEVATNEWVTWNDMDTIKLISDPLNLIDSEPRHLLFDPATFKPIAYIARELFSRGKNLLLACHPNVDQSVLANIIKHMPYIMEHFQPRAYTFSKDANHKLLRKMLASVLPETNSKSTTSSIALRLPLLSILGFHSNPRSTSSELIRYIINHKEIQSEFGAINELISGLVLLLCGDESALNTRVSSHTFSIAVAKMSEKAEKQAVSLAIRELWGINKPEIGSVMIDLLNNVNSVFKFSIYHLLTVLQRVGIVMGHIDQSKLVDVLAYQCVNIFYDAYHNDSILANISVATREVSKILELENNTDVFEIAGKCVLSNINSNSYRPVTCFGDLVRKESSRRGTGQRSLIKFTSMDRFNDEETDVQTLRGINTSLRYDILATINTITTPMCHIKFYTEIPKLSRKLIKNACAISKSVMCEKHLYVPLIKSFHDTFLEAGKTKVHHVLFIDENTLTKEDLTILNLLQKTDNVYGLFTRSELLDLMTDIYTKKGLCADPFHEDSMETRKDYNTIIADFMTDCKMYFHFAVVSLHLATPQSNCPYTTVYTPFFEAKDYIESCIETEFNNLCSFDSKYVIKHHFLLDTFHKISEWPLIKKCPYLISAQNLSHIIKAFVERTNKNHGEIQGQLNDITDLINVKTMIKKFMDTQVEKMNAMEEHLVTLNANLVKTTEDLVNLKAETETEMENANREAQVLNDEKDKAEQMKRELAHTLKETNKILETAMTGIKNIKATDMAVIKNMHQPPRGVILVIMALCVILGQSVNINATTDEEFNKIFNTGRVIMSDAGFLKKITNAVHDSLSPQILDAIRKIVSDPKFEPKVIERSSTAAKSICVFIRAIVPYADAMEVHKNKMKAAEEVQANLEQLQMKYAEALNKFNKCQKDQYDTSMKIEEMNRQIERTKESIVVQTDKIEDYKLFMGIIDKYFDSVMERYNELTRAAERNEAVSFLNTVFSSIAGPFNDQERDQLFDIIKFGDFTRKDILSTDEPLVAKWERTNSHVSWTWKENTSFLSPENGRWVVCQNAFMLSSNYLKRVINRQSVSFISALSPTFDDDFVSLISSQVGVVIYDFDFINPNLVVPVVCRARETNTPFVYNNETINVPKDFFVVFDCKELPEYYSFGMDVELVSFTIDEEENTEQIALRSFELLCHNEYSNSIMCDVKLLESEQKFKEISEDLRTSLINVGTNIFNDKKSQTDFKVLMQHAFEQKDNIKVFKENFNHLFEKYDEVYSLTKGVVAELQKYTVTSSLWKMFAGAFAQRDSIRFEDFHETAISVMTPYLASTTQGNHEKDSFNSIETVVKQSRSFNPVIIVSRDSSFPFNALFNIYNGQKMTITTPKESKHVVMNSIQIGTPVCVVCTSNESLIEIYSAISKNLDANFVGAGFRLFICVLGDQVELTSDLLTKSDIIYFKQPKTVQDITNATEFGLKKELINSGITALDAEISISNRERYNARVHCFENAHLALQCCSILNSTNKEDVLDFIRNYLYANGRAEKKEQTHVVECNSCDSIDLSTTNPNVFIESQKVEYALTERKNVTDLVPYIDLEGKDNGQKIGNFEILGDIGNKTIKCPTFSIRHFNESMKEVPLYTDGKTIVTFYVTNDAPLEFVTL